MSSFLCATDDPATTAHPPAPWAPGVGSHYRLRMVDSTTAAATPFVAAAVAAAALLAAPTPRMGDAWHRVGDGMAAGISGMTARERADGGVESLIVRDNKEAGQNRLALVRWAPGAAPVAAPLAWRGTPPADLEALDAVPGRSGEYVAVASRGTAYHFRLARGEARVLHTFELPGATKDTAFEGFALTALRGSSIVAVWANRGEDSRPATLRAARFDAERGVEGEVAALPFRAPFPTLRVRHVSDAKVVADGRVLVSSASDPGDDGPFTSALNDAGRVSVEADGTVRLTARGPAEPLETYEGHKIEALAPLLSDSSRALLGTDDENDGGSVRMTRLP